MNDLPQPIDVLDFWWTAGVTKWYGGGETFDAECRERFLKLVEMAASGELKEWEETPHGCLALLIVLDQFSRNIFRGSARAFAQDAQALALAERAITTGFDRYFPAPARNFFYMPFTHAEDLDAQGRCCDYFRGSGDQDSYYYALLHMDAIRRFGRFPHRNAVVGRETTAEEQLYLDTGGFSA